MFKFGGASVRNASAIWNMLGIIKRYPGEELVIVVSALGKTTNTLEKLVKLAFEGLDYQQSLSSLKTAHFDIISELFEEDHPVFDKINATFDRIDKDLEKVTDSIKDFDQFYDLIVSKGEILSTNILAEFFNAQKVKTKWLDAREYIKTDRSFREGNVLWELTSRLINKDLPRLAKEQLLLTQGFIGSTENNEPTTLGREGSDFTAAILASCLNAENVTIWKDVPGILNADPKIVNNAVLFTELPYNEASEMTYYGAKVIHPKTIKPLANKKIPLYVKGFDHPEEPGTCIHECKVKNITPTIIFLHNQCLFSFKVKDFTFVEEDNLSKIFKVFHDLNIKIHVMQNSAISFSVCFDHNERKVEELKERLKGDFNFYYNTGLTLITLKNYKPELLEEYKNQDGILLEQISRRNYRILVADENIKDYIHF